MQILELKSLSTGLTIDELAVYSMHNSSYTVQVLLAGKWYGINQKKKTYTTNNIANIRKDFSRFSVQKFIIKESYAYDEMIGMYDELDASHPHGHAQNSNHSSGLEQPPLTRH